MVSTIPRRQDLRRGPGAPRVALSPFSGETAYDRVLRSFLAAVAPVAGPEAPDPEPEVPGGDPEGQSPAQVEFVQRYYWRPDLFVLECFTFHPERHEGPTSYQLEILREIGRQRRVSFRGPRGLGKTALASWVVWWWALTRDARGIDWKIPTTAGSGVQLQEYLWPEIRKWARRLRWEVIGRAPLRDGRELLQETIKLTYGEAFAVNSTNNEAIEGAHATALFVLFDEAKIIPDRTFDSIEGAFANARADTGSEMLALAISTPGDPVGRFYEIHSGEPGYEHWWVRHVTLEECVAARRLDPEQAVQLRKAWGVDSALYQQHVLGNFYAEEARSVIPLAWVEAAVDRWRARFRDEEGAPVEGWNAQRLPRFSALGVDVAAGGGDQTCFAPRYGMVVPGLEYHDERDTMAVTGMAKRAYERHTAPPPAGPGPDADPCVLVDVIGVGAGVTYRLAELGLPVIAWHAAEKTEERDATGLHGFINRRSWGWWHMRELLDPANEHALELPPDKTLIADLVAPTHKITSSGAVQVESKEDIRKRRPNGKSTDAGDAVMQAFSREATDRMVESAVIPGESYSVGGGVY